MRLSDELKFGKYKGRTVLSVADENAGYLVYLLDNMEGFDLTPPSKRYVQELASIQSHNRMMKSAYGGINRNQDWGFNSDCEVNEMTNKNDIPDENMDLELKYVRAVKACDVAELPDNLVAALKTVKMDSRHDHLNDLLDDKD